MKVTVVGSNGKVLYELQVEVLFLREMKKKFKNVTELALFSDC